MKTSNNVYDTFGLLFLGYMYLTPSQSRGLIICSSNTLHSGVGPDN